MMLAENELPLFERPAAATDAYASSGFVIDASRKRVNRYTLTLCSCGCTVAIIQTGQWTVRP